MKKYLWIGGIILALALGAQAIGTDDEIKSALSITTQDMTRLKRAVGQHQSLRDGNGARRDATTAEAIAEVKSRLNEFVRREEAKVGGDTLGQWGGI